jgi:CheY-like chemotaxis protein
MEAIGRLAGGVAHDFNNMLSVIIGYGHSMLKNKNPDDPDHELLEEIVHAGERSAELTHQLLAFSRQQILQPKVINLNRVLADLDRMLSRLIGEDIELVLDLHEDLGNVYADPVQIQQVVMNLAINARDAMPNGGKLTISTEPFMEDIADETRMKVEQNEQKPLIVLRVQDNGVGMDDQTQARIFEPFFTTKTKYKGIGLGLAMVFGFVKQSGGDITVRSAVGEGTTFSMFLPEVTEAEYVTNEFDTRTVQAVGSGKKKETILVVEDETEVRKMISFILEADGYKIVAADSGPAALKLLDEHKKDIELMLTDVIMPTMSGSDLAKEVRSICPDLQVIYMTGYSDSVILARDVLMSDSYMLRKPFAPKVLRAQVRTALDASTAK